MTKINIDTINKLANLSRLDFKDKDLNVIVNDLNRMLQFIDKLNELDTHHIAPKIYMNETSNHTRADEVKKEISQADGLKNAPKKDSDFFKVPKVVDKNA
jgi:aspartyl-tRNA(Asn)/glutamyl-tRNA(Gln) amidotransferase subunit C